MLVYPMTFYVLYIWALVFRNFRIRVRAIKNKEVSAKYFKSFQGDPVPDHLHILGRHYDNQFQVPLLFFIVCVAHMVLAAANIWTIGLAWVFILTRLAHSWIHLGRNHLMFRVTAFASGWVVVVILWLQLCYFVFLAKENFS